MDPNFVGTLKKNKILTKGVKIQICVTNAAKE
jgi:hypothetical protein